MEPSISNLLNGISKVLELVSLIEKDFSGVRVRSPSVLIKDELLEQVEEVIKKISEDIAIVESGIKDMKTWFILRKQALSGINNLHHSLKKTLDEAGSAEEIKESVRMFSLASQEDFIHNIFHIKKLWHDSVMNVTQAMNRVLSIMLVTQEKIERYKTQLDLDEQDYSNVLERLLKSLLEKNLSNFIEIEKDLRTKLLHGE
ncbi:MAG: hypothetical protein HWN67_11750 [Candidatus Helarchaeota archaeon]|nr:hypothetical protein [Candidatus Helarchaeota archaeon]